MTDADVDPGTEAWNDTRVTTDTSSRTTSGKPYDVVVAGGGPAGSMAALELARSGARVLVVDRKTFPRDKLCGGLLTEKSFALLADTFGTQPFEGVIDHTANGFALYNGSRRLNAIATREKLFFVSRRSFDHFLLQEAAKAGADVREGQVLAGLDGTTALLGRERVEAEWILGADGVNSRVRKCLGYRFKHNVASSIQVDIPLCDLPHPENFAIPRIFFGYVRYGWAWIFPKGDHVAAGLGTFVDNARDFRRTFKRFLTDHFGHAYETLPAKGALLPYGAFLTKPARDRIILCGDAAGFTEPITGEGIYFALLSGRHAARSILHRDAPAQAYTKACRKEIIPILRQARFFRTLLFNPPFFPLAMRKIGSDAKYLHHFMNVLTGREDYVRFFRNVILR